jgi:hypothetical protein
MKNTKLLYLIYGLIILFVGAIIGALITRNMGSVNQPAATPNSTTQTTSDGRPFFDGQTAFVQGQVISRNGNTVTIKNLKDQTKEYPLAENIKILKPAPGRPASSSSDLNQIELNKDMVANFTLGADGNYQITSITLTPQLPAR